MHRLVVLGTGTDVGKTYASAALLSGLRRRGLQATALKPIETGIADAGDAPPPRSDSGVLERAASAPPPRPHPLYRFRRPVSPHLAARETTTQIDLDRIVDWVNDATLRCPTHMTLIETAGGAFSPLGPAISNLDLAAALEPAQWLLVAPDSLGVLHDVTATLTALRARARAPDYLLLSASRPPDASTGTNADELRRLRLADPIAVLGPGDTSGLDALLDAVLAAGA